jgi:uncharacterized protein YhfF
MDSKSKVYLERFLSSLPAKNRPSYTQFDAYHFCADEESANHCANLVLEGEKRATAGLLWSYEAENEPLPEVGQLSVITNWDGIPQCIVEVAGIEIKPFNEVTAEFAFEEGEGDKSLEFWRGVHWEFFRKECEEIGKHPAGKMPVVLERFKVLWIE